MTSTKKLRVVLVGAGNVMTTRHLPALVANKKLFDVRGIVDADGSRSARVAKTFGIPNHCIVPNMDAGVPTMDALSRAPWMRDVDAAIIGVPPRSHAAVAKACLSWGKHVLVEKPFALTIEQATELSNMADTLGLVLAVKHNFQFSRSFLRLSRLLEDGALGKVKSMHCAQLTNYARRIPPWAEDLPGGLFYDESPHFLYLARAVTGDDVCIKSAYRHRSMERRATPKIINLNLESGGVPITIYWNFDSPVCEWYFTVFGEDRVATIDLFRDILLVLPNDAPHLGYQVMRTSVLSTIQHWKGVAVNGVDYLRNRLYYGFDIAQRNFHRAVTEGDVRHIDGMSGADGVWVTRLQHAILQRLDCHA